MSFRPPPRLFVYGTLLDPDLFAAVAGAPIRRFRPRAAKAIGVRAVCAAHEPMPAIVRGGGMVAGLMLTNIDARAWRRLLFYEDDDYALGPIKLTLDGGRHARAQGFWPRRAMPTANRSWTLREWQRADKRAALAAARQFMEYAGAPPQTDLAKIWRDIKTNVSA